MRIFGQSLGKQRHNFPQYEQMQQDDEEKPTRPRLNTSSPQKKVQFQKKHSPIVTGAISTVMDTFILDGKGTLGANFSGLSFTNLPAASKRVIQPVYATYTMTNYANVDFPQAIYLVCNQIQGHLNKTGQATHIIGVLVPLGAAVPVYNSGGIIGYNMTYGLNQNDTQYDITNVNDLTFDIAITTTGPPLAYPLSESMSVGLRVASANF